MDDWGRGRGRVARAWAIGLLAVATVTLVAATAASAAPFVSVEAKLVRIPGGGALVTGRIVWDQAAARRDHMSVGNLRLVAVSDHGHLPTVLVPNELDAGQYEGIGNHPVQDIHLRIKPELLHHIRPGNRVVLTASQHRPVVGTRTDRTYVTVGELQPFGTPQDRIGRRDCSEVAIVPGAQLNKCDLVGAFLDRALVSTREAGTRMLLADLTGATMHDADLTGLSVAGGRLNGADVTHAVLDNVSLAGAEAAALNATGATSGKGAGTVGANVFDARLTDANFSEAVLDRVSLVHSRFDGANFSGATWNAVIADTASFRGANLAGLNGSVMCKMCGSTVYFADFTDAHLKGSPVQKFELEWATLCHTKLPDSFPSGAGDRDCRTQIDPGPSPAANPYVVIDNASLQRLPGPSGGVKIRATITWNAPGTKYFGMTAGDVRVVAVDGSTGLPTPIDSSSVDLSPTTTPTIYDHTVTDRTAADRVKLAALNPGNRVVLTATQHQPRPREASKKTDRSYVTVHTLQPGPGRGRVGMRDCSNIVLKATPPTPDQYDFCDLPGAVLKQAKLSGSMRKADLTGAELGDAEMSGMSLDGAAMGGAIATGADFDSVSMIDAFAPRLTMPHTLISRARLEEARLDEADFAGAKLIDTKLATSSLRRATFSDAMFDGVDLGFARLPKANLDGVEAPPRDSTPGRPSSLFLANLTQATLKGSRWANNGAGETPFRWPTLCDTILPAGVDVDGNRDCPR